VVRRHREEGATVVEMALALPLLLLVILGVVEFGRVIAIENELESASRDAARYATSAGGTPAHFIDCDGIRNAARQRLTLSTLANSDIDITYDDGTGAALVDTMGNVIDCQGGTAPYEDVIASEVRITVTVRSTISGITPVIGNFIGTPTLSSVDTRTVFRGPL